MATTDWTLTRDEIIQAILETTHVTGVGIAGTTAQVTMVSRMLNQYTKWLQKAYGSKRWKLEWTEKAFSAASQVTGTDGEIYTCTRGHTSATATKPITGDNWTSYWKLAGSTGGVWATSTAYTATGDFSPADDLISIEQAFLRKNGLDTEVKVIGWNEYLRINNKQEFGDIVQIAHDHKLTDKIYTYPQLEDVDDIILHYQQRLQVNDFDISADNPDFPVNWIEPIVYNVALRVAMVYHTDETVMREIRRLAESTLIEAIGSDLEVSGDIKFVV